MRVEKQHAHAYTSYSLLRWTDYINLVRSVAETRIYNYKSLTVHLPFEIQHPKFRNIGKATSFISFGESLKRLFRIRLFWENAPWLNVGSWNLKFGNTNWDNVPKNIDICLDTGHLMLGEKNKRTFNRKLKIVIDHFGQQIKHLHLHENNFITDQHLPVPGKVISKKEFKKLIKSRSYIIEKGE